MNIVNKNYTTDTIMYAIHSAPLNENVRGSYQIVEGNCDDCQIKMGNHLNNNYDYYLLQILTFSPNSHGETSNLCIDGWGENLYSTDGKNNFIDLGFYTDFHTKRATKTEDRSKYIIKNWNNHILRFRFREITTNEYVESTMVNFRNWSIIFALTPIYDDPNHQTIRYIHWKQYETFSYFLSTVNRISGDQYESVIEFGPLSDNYSEYFVQCNAIYGDHMKGVSSNNMKQTTVAVENLYDTGYGGFPFQPNLHILGYFYGNSSIGQNGDVIQETNATGDYSIGIIKNMKHKRQIKISYYNSSFRKLSATLGAAFVLDPDFHISINLLITPIQ